MKPPINRSYARLLMLTSYKHLNFQILCSLRMFYYNSIEMWFTALFQAAETQ